MRKCGISIVARLDEAVQDAAVRVVASVRNRSTIALAGGGTPKRLYEALTAPSWRQRVDWRAVQWFWGDERAVPPDHADSNYRMARESLLDPLGVPAGQIHRMPADARDADAAAMAYEQAIRSVAAPGPDGRPALDLVLLGIGTDGHTASLFPGTAALDETERLVVANDVPQLNTRRMTMTFPLLLAARSIVVFVTGADKAEIVSRLLGPRRDTNLPAARLREAGHRVTWVLDAAAAARLETPPAVP